MTPILVSMMVADQAVQIGNAQTLDIGYYVTLALREI